MSEFTDFIKVINSAQDKHLLEDFLLGITTPTERKELVRRLEIIRRLLKGDPHHQIAGDLKVGVATVTRGSRELAQGRFQVLRSAK